MWKRTRQRLMGKGMCPCGELHKRGRGKGKKKKGKEISHSAPSIVDVLADVQHVHDLQRVSKIVACLVVPGIEDPDGECPGVLTSVSPIDWEYDVKTFSLAFTVAKTFLEDPVKWGVIRMVSSPGIGERRFRIIGVVGRGGGGGGRGRGANPIRQFVIGYD